MLQRLVALARKEFIQIVRDRRTLAMMVMLPLLWLVMFGYAFSFDVKEIQVAVVDVSGTETGKLVADAFRQYERFQIHALTDLSEKGIADAMHRDELDMGLILPPGYGGDTGESVTMRVVIDGTDLFAAQSAIGLIQRALEPIQDDLTATMRATVQTAVKENIASQMAARKAELLEQMPPPIRDQMAPQLKQSFTLDPSAGLDLATLSTPQLIPEVDIRYNPDLQSAPVMIPGLLGLVVMFMTTMMTAMGIVREREYGTMEQLVVTPIRPIELMLGKLLPYFLIAAVDFALVFAAGIYLFDLTFAGNLPVFLGLSLLLVITTLGLGLLLSTVATNQQQAMQLAVFAIIPQILLSGLIFPINSMPKVIQYIAAIFPFTYYVPIARGMFIKGQEFALLVQPAIVLAIYAVAVLTLASLRFRKRLG